MAGNVPSVIGAPGGPYTIVIGRAASVIFNENNQCCVEYEITDDDEDGVPILETEPVHYLPALPSLGVIWRF
jgi:hypothetical protein